MIDVNEYNDDVRSVTSVKNRPNPTSLVLLRGMPTIQFSARSARLSVWLSKWACPKITSGQRNLTWGTSPP